MKICRFNEGRLGVVRDGQIFDVSSALEFFRRRTIRFRQKTG